jgi:alpha-amylase/alpha-mannosidase (GH57 family)
VWIGDPQKNRAWEFLCAAKTAVDRALSNAELDDESRAAIAEQLAVCEGSDWFWWLGGGNRPQDSAEFDSLFRLQLEALYRQLGMPVPEDLRPIVETVARADAPLSGEGGAMRRAGQ